MRALRVGVMLMIGLSVLAHGSTEIWSQALLIGAISLLFMVWGFAQARAGALTIHWNLLYWPMLGYGAFVACQWLFSLSVYPYLTKIEFLRLSTYFLVFFLVTEAFPSIQDVQGLSWFLIVFGFCVAMFAIIQHFSFNGKIYWLRELRYGGYVFGPYVNHNHFAGLMELILPLALAILIQRALGSDRLMVVAVLTVFPMAALVLSASRGGITVFLGQLGVLFLLASPGRSMRLRWFAVATVLLLAGGLTLWMGVSRTTQRFMALQQFDVAQNLRMEMFGTTFRAFSDSPWLGTGAGTLAVVYPQFASKYIGKHVDHAHNDYLEMLAETGIVGASCSAAFMLVLITTAVSRLQMERNHIASAIRLGALVGCLGLMVHGLVDFNFHIPANAMLFFVMAAIATRRDVILPVPFTPVRSGFSAAGAMPTVR